MSTFATAARLAGDPRVELVAPARDEPLGEREADLGLEPPDRAPRQLRQLPAQPLDQLRGGSTGTRSGSGK